MICLIFSSKRIYWLKYALISLSKLKRIATTGEAKRNRFFFAKRAKYIFAYWPIIISGITIIVLMVLRTAVDFESYQCTTADERWAVIKTIRPKTYIFFLWKILDYAFIYRKDSGDDSLLSTRLDATSTSFPVNFQ